MRYRLNEADIVLPDDWKDMSINNFVLPAGPQGNALSLTVTRDHNSPEVDLTSYTDQQLIIAAKKLPHYKYISRQGLYVGGQVAIQADYTWRTPESKNIHQRQAVLKVGLTFLVFTLTAMVEDAENIELFWQRTMGEVQFV